VLTGPAALRFHRLSGTDAKVVDVLVPRTCRRRDVAFVRMHRTSRMPGLVFPAGKVSYVPPARAVADTVRGLSDPNEVRNVVANAVQRRRVQVWQLADELRCGPIQGTAHLRAALAEVADGVRSVAEADLRTLIKREHLPVPMFNPRLFVGESFIAVPDAWWPQACVAVEIESREWHLAPSDWERTLARDAKMSAHGIVVLHFPPRRLRSEPRMAAAEIRSALEAGRGREAHGISALPAR